MLAGDDHPIVRSGVRLILATAPEFRLVAEAGDAAGTFAAVERARPDLLILDLWMGGNDGLELIRRVVARHPAARILVYSVNDERVFGPRALKAGAAGYLMKHTAWRNCSPPCARWPPGAATSARRWPRSSPTPPCTRAVPGPAGTSAWPCSTHSPTASSRCCASSARATPALPSPRAWASARAGWPASARRQVYLPGAAGSG